MNKRKEQNQVMEDLKQGQATTSATGDGNNTAPSSSSKGRGNSSRLNHNGLIGNSGSGGDKSHNTINQDGKDHIARSGSNKKAYSFSFNFT